MLKRVTDDRGLSHAVSDKAQAGNEQMASGYGLKLKTLRERTSLSQAECGKALGIGQGAFSNYENQERYSTNPIPMSAVLGLIPLLVGQGVPPIRIEEVLELNPEIKRIQNILAGVAGRPVKAAVPHEMCDLIPQPNTIRVRYTIERGVYRDADALQMASDEGRSTAPVLPLRHYPHDKQWGAIIIDGSGQRIGLPKHTLLHCVDASVLPPSQLPAGSVVVALRSRDNLAEVILAVVEGYRGRVAQLKDVATDKPVDADVLGGAVYRYGPVTS